MNLRSHLSLALSRHYTRSILRRKSIADDILLLKKLFFSTDHLVPILGRLGFTESRIIARSLFSSNDASAEQEAELYSGVFPGGFLSSLFCSAEQINALSLLDVLGLWPVPYLKTIIKYSEFSGLNVHLDALNPLFDIYHDTGFFSSILANKKVLIVSPFKNTIESNLERIDDIPFLSSVIPQDSTYEVLKAPYGTFASASSAESFVGGSWINNLAHLKHRMSNTEFDICILGCGAYGLPLAAHSKIACSRPAIHIGGAHQLLFGIRGNRWAVEPKYSAMASYMLQWNGPLPCDLPPAPASVENGAYF